MEGGWYILFVKSREDEITFGVPPHQRAGDIEILHRSVLYARPGS